MNLQDFIKETIVQIAESVVDIQEHFDEKGIDAIVNPREFQDIEGKDFAGRYKPTSSQTGAQTNYYRLVDAVEFDVAVTVESDTKKEVGGKLKVFDMGIGAEGSEISKQANVSKVKFKIPLVMPHGKENKTQ
jgi:uncharacterized Fe-S center protein